MINLAMKKVIRISGLICIVLFLKSCSSVLEKSDKEKSGLSKEVQKIFTISFEPKVKFGEPTKVAVLSDFGIQNKVIQYNNDGNITRYKTFVDVRPIEGLKYSYNEKKIEEITQFKYKDIFNEDYVSDEPIPDGKILFKYNEQNRIIQRTNYDENGKEWHSWKYFVNDNGLRDSSHFYLNTEISTRSHFYYQDTTKIKEVELYREGDTISKLFYTNSRVTKEIGYRKIQAEYFDENGQPFKRLLETSDTTYYSYNDKGLLIEENKPSKMGFGYREVYKSDYQFDKYGNWIEKVEYYGVTMPEEEKLLMEYPLIITHRFIDYDELGTLEEFEEEVLGSDIMQAVRLEVLTSKFCNEEVLKANVSDYISGEYGNMYLIDETFDVKADMGCEYVVECILQSTEYSDVKRNVKLKCNYTEDFSQFQVKTLESELLFE